MKIKALDKQNNSVLSIAVLFLLTFYIYADFGIRRSYGFILLLAAAMGLTAWKNTVLPRSPYRVWYWLMIIPCTLFGVASNSYRTDNTTAMTIYMVVSGVIILLVKTNSTEISRVFKWIDIGAVVFAFYVILVKLVPSFYTRLISPRLIPSTREFCAMLIRQGYGVPIGGSTTYANYIIAISMFYHFSQVLFGRKRKEIDIWFIARMAVYLTAILFENRRSELLVLLMTFLIIYALSLDMSHLIDFLKKLGGFAAAVLVLAGVLFILAKAGHLARFEEIFQKVADVQSGDANNQDVTSGRLDLWKKAWQLFLAHPVLGIGWEQFINNNFYRHDVHNTYLQWLCETGIVGFVLILTPILALFILSLKDARRIIRKEDASPEVLSMCIVGLGMQLFFLMINVIDPAFYHLNYFCFFSLAIILSESARRFYSQEKGNLLRIIL